MVFQSYALFPHLSVAENIVFGLRVRRVSRAERDARLKRVAEIVGLATTARAQAVAIVRRAAPARRARPRHHRARRAVCLMDEPLSESRRQAAPRDADSKSGRCSSASA